MSYELQGKVKVIMDTQTFSSGFTKREFVVTTQDQYPQDIKFESVKDKVALVDALRPGQDVTVHFDVRGNEYKDRYYVNLVAWRIQTDAASAAEGPQDVPPADTDLPDSLADENYPF